MVALSFQFVVASQEDKSFRAAKKRVNCNETGNLHIKRHVKTHYKYLKTSEGEESP
jgi:ribosomal protein L35